jgi:hypothetical protein
MRYDGEFKAGKMEGYGVHSWPNGMGYEGEFKADMVDGYGVYTWLSGERYEGEFKLGKMDGRGYFSLADGRVFEGRFREDRPVYGQMTELDGTVFRATFDGATCITAWRPLSKTRAGSLEGGWREARGPHWLRAFKWEGPAGAVGRFGGSCRGMCPLAGSLVKPDGSVWSVVYDGRTTFAEGPVPVIEVHPGGRLRTL